MLFWRGRLGVDFLPSFELISGVTHAILDEVRRWRNWLLDPVYPWALSTRCRPNPRWGPSQEQGRDAGLKPNGEKDVLGLRIEPPLFCRSSRAAHVGDRDRP
jgi:hypothetical protein